MEAVVQKLRSGKLVQDCGKKFTFGKDSTKRMAEPLPDEGGKKRILGDVTNLGKMTYSLLNRNEGVKKGKISQKSTSSIEKKKSSSVTDVKQTDDALENVKTMQKEMPLRKEHSKTLSNDSDALYVTALEDSVILETSPIKEVEATNEKNKSPEQPHQLPEVEDFDATCKNDPYNVPEYARDIFKYYKSRELLFKISKYLDSQPEVSKAMRAILIDWMVEVQESFELNHETLYLAVKLVDRFLMQHAVPKAKLQLIGATSIFVAAKFDERLPPLVDDFLYICDDSYTREELLRTEKKILQTIDFDLGIPLSYRFLRRYSRCARVSMELLTLARYILETSLMDYDLIDVLDSKIAAAALLLALKMKSDNWSVALRYYSGYEENELKDVLIQLNKNISAPTNKHLQTIKLKYSHQIFFQVAKIPPLNFQKIPKAFCNSLP